MASTRFTQQHIIELNEKPASSLLMNKELQNIYKGTNELDDEAKIHRAKQADPTLADTAPEKHVTNAQAKKWDDIANTFSGVSPSSFVAATEVVTTATANKILKLNADGKLPTDIVGNATTASDSLLLNGKSDTAFQAVAEKDQPGGYAGLDANGKIDSEWIKDASETVKGVVELATPAEVLAGEDTERVITPATLTAKILGTVSEVEGVPTGAIIESGSNANGTYVKFADGTLVCVIIRFMSVTTLNNAAGWLYTDQLYITLPAAYISNSFIIAGVTGIGSALPMFASFMPLSENSITGYIVNPIQITTATNTVVRLMTIGRWY